MNERIQEVLNEWHEAAFIDSNSRNGKYQMTREHYDATYPKTAKAGDKYIRLDDGTSGAFMVDTTDGTIYRIKAYGVPNKQQPIGNIATITGADLVRLRYIRWSAGLKKSLGF